MQISSAAGLRCEAAPAAAEPHAPAKILRPAARVNTCVRASGGDCSPRTRRIAASSGPSQNPAAANSAAHRGKGCTTAAANSASPVPSRLKQAINVAGTAD